MHLLVILLLLLATNGPLAYEIHTVDEDSCRNGSMEIRATASGATSAAIVKSSSSRSILCRIQLQVPDGYRALTSLRQIDLQQNPDGSCQDYLKIDYVMCQKLTNPDEGPSFVSKKDTPNFLNLDYYTESSESDNLFHSPKKFELTFTAFKSAATGACDNITQESFLCSNRRCIWSGLVCDGHNNCGDRSDEESEGISRCGTKGSRGTTALVILGVTILAVLLLMCVSTLLCSKNEKVRSFSMRLRTRTRSVLPRFSRTRTQQQIR